MYTSALCTHLYIVICEGAKIINLQQIGCATDSCAGCNRLCICNVVDVLCMVFSDSRCVSVELC